MNALSTAELTGMRATAESSFFDSCKLGTPTLAGWNADPGNDSYSYGSEIACGFDEAPTGEAQDGSAAPLADAMLRLPIGTTVSETYRVRLTKRHGAAMTNVDYTIEGTPDRGVSALVLKLKRITGATPR